MTQTTALVTGANKGLGKTVVRRLAELGWTVYLGSRDAARGEAAAKELDAVGDFDIIPIPFDVTSDESVSAAVEVVRERSGRLDVLINNAGITGPWVDALETGPEELLATYETNVFGPVRVTRAFVPLLQQSEHPRIVMVSRGLGSIAITADPERFESQLVSLTYTSSKTALNMITSQYAKALPAFRINAADPGYTATDLNGNQGHQTVEEGTDAIVALAQVTADGPTGGYFDRSGPLPW